MNVKIGSKKQNFGLRFLIVFLPNLLFFIDLFIAIFLNLLFGLPWLLFPKYDILYYWRFIELIIGYILSVSGIIFLTWGTLSIGISRAEGKEIGNSLERSKLIISGAYAHCRHPITLGFIFVIPGTSLIFDSVTLMILTIIYIPKMIILLIYEEKELRRRFGEKYDTYKTEVPFLIPRKAKNRLL